MELVGPSPYPRTNLSILYIYICVFGLVKVNFFLKFPILNFPPKPSSLFAMCKEFSEFINSLRLFYSLALFDNSMHRNLNNKASMSIEIIHLKHYIYIYIYIYIYREREREREREVFFYTCTRSSQPEKSFREFFSCEQVINPWLCQK